MYKKKPITIIASEETYNNLATFDDITQLNDAVRKHKESHADNLNNNQIQVLDLLHRYSAKYKGVSFLTKNNIANQLDISRRTVIRACQKLESLGIIKQHEMKRKSDMQQTSNAIVIQNIDVIEDFIKKNESHDNTDDTQAYPKNDENCHSKKTTTFLKQNLNNRKEDKNTSTFDHTFVSSNVPKQLVDAISPFFNRASDVYAIYKRLKLATREHPVSLHDDIDAYVSVFKQTVYRLKKGLVRGEYLGYLYGAFKRTCHDINNRYYMPSDSVYFDWLVN